MTEETSAKRGRGRPRKYHTPEEQAKAKRDAVARSVARKETAKLEKENALLAKTHALNQAVIAFPAEKLPQELLKPYREILLAAIDLEKMMEETRYKA